jgi:hypothetical protein
MRIRMLMSVLALLGLVAMTAVGQTVTLKYKMEKGKTYRYADTMKINTTQEMMGQEVKVENTISAVTRVAVEDQKSDGNYSLLMSTDTMRVTIKSPRMDTTMVPTELLHKRTRVTATALGEVLAREVVDSLKAGAMTRGMGSISSREMLRLPVFNGKGVKSGDKWTYSKTDTQSVDMGKTISTATFDYTFAGMEKVKGRELVKLTFAGKMSVNSKGTMMGMDVFTEGGGKMSGTIYFDDKAGMLFSEDSRIDMDLTAAVKGQQNMTIPITQQGTYRHMFLGN